MSRPIRILDAKPRGYSLTVLDVPVLERGGKLVLDLRALHEAAERDFRYRRKTKSMPAEYVPPQAPVAVFSTVNKATTAAHQLGRYLLNLGDFVDTYTEGTASERQRLAKARRAANPRPPGPVAEATARAKRQRAECADEVRQVREASATRVAKAREAVREAQREGRLRIGQKLADCQGEHRAILSERDRLREQQRAAREPRAAKPPRAKKVSSNPLHYTKPGQAVAMTACGRRADASRRSASKLDVFEDWPTRDRCPECWAAVKGAR